MLMEKQSDKNLTEHVGAEAIKKYDELGFVTGLLCPFCKQERLKPTHVDDAGTQWYKCENCGRQSATPKTQQRRQLEETCHFLTQIGDYSILPLFDKEYRTLHPALDYIEDAAYIGVCIPAKEQSEKGERIREHHFLVTSKRELILYHEQMLTQRNFRINSKTVKIPSRWSIQSIRAWLDGKATVDPKEVYIAVKTAFETYIELDDPAIFDFLTLWSIGTYLFPIFEAYPYLYIGGMKGVGKTKLLTLLSHLCFNAKFSGSLTSACLFRMVEGLRCTLLLDETENLANPEKAEDIRSLLLFGYKRGGTADRINKDSHAPEAFEVYSPKAIANIRGLENVLEDRCISIILKRGKNPSLLNSEPKHDAQVWQQLRDMLHVFALERFIEVSELSEHSELSERGEEAALTGRLFELWKPILSLAKYFDQWFDGLYEKMQRFAIQNSKDKLAENLAETAEYLLVQTLLDVVKDSGYYKVSDIKDALQRHYDEPQSWLSTKWIGNALRRLGFKDKRRTNNGYEYRLTSEALEDLAERLNINNENKRNSGSTQCSLSSLASVPSFSYSSKVSEHENNMENEEKSQENKILEESKNLGTLGTIGTASSCSKSIDKLISEFYAAFPHDRAWKTVEFEMFMKKRGLSEDEAQRMLQQMKKRGEIHQVYSDLWRWT